jgi:hypothetical protein
MTIRRTDVVALPTERDLEAIAQFSVIRPGAIFPSLEADDDDTIPP